MRKLSISQIIVMLIFCVLFTIMYVLKAWAFVVICLIFILFFLANYLQRTKEDKLTMTVFFIIALYTIIKYFTLVAEKSEPYYKELSILEKLLDSNLVLILVTSLYVLFTSMMFSEMKKSRIASQRPNIIARPEQDGASSLVCLIIKNIGGGPAFDINTDYKITKDDGKINEYHWNNSVHQSMETVKLVLDNDWIHKFYKKNKKLEVNIHYTDKDKTVYTEPLIFDLKKLLAGIEKTTWVADDKKEHEIAKSLSGISTEIKKISESLNYLSKDSKIKHTKRTNKLIKIHLERLRKNKKTT